MSAPCKDCTDRHLKCHGVCEKYKQYTKQLEFKKLRDKAQKEADLGFIKRRGRKIWN